VDTDEQALLAVERAMVRIRRSMGRRSLGKALLAEREQPENLALFAVLDAVEEGPGESGPVTVTGVAERMDLDASRASRVVSAAVASGHVARVASQDDGRRVGLELTASGRAVIDRVHRFRQQRFAEAMRAWTPAERAEFARLLTRFTAPDGDDGRLSPLPRGQRPGAP